MTASYSFNEVLNSDRSSDMDVDHLRNNCEESDFSVKMNSTDDTIKSDLCDNTERKFGKKKSQYEERDCSIGELPCKSKMDFKEEICKDESGDNQQCRKNSKGPKAGPKPTKSKKNSYMCLTKGDHSKKMFICKSCGRTFQGDASNMIKHERTHSGEQPYKCVVCEKTFTRSTHLRTHMKIHSGEKPFKCDLCELSFRTNSDKQKHMRIHTGEKPYECTVCGKSFSRSDHLTGHMRIHTGVKPYSCCFCEKAFTCISDMKKHTKVHHKDKK